ncbi:MAG: STAS domain-containing protein [Chromatiales bacterium]|nr:STAS domain-containing protein [Chromatiales bacterium]
MFGDVTVVTPSGRIDHNSAEKLHEMLLPVIRTQIGERRVVVLDMADIPYMSSAGLRVLMLASREAKKEGGRVVIAALQSDMQEIFEISRFNMVFDTFDSVRTAIASISPNSLAAFESG